jgi:pyruvate/2-oxoglutarate dehydrogenase complex dihydrolipoamide acyltransferase (E2) component
LAILDGTIMAIEFKVPELGENIESGDVVNVLVREGQVIEANQGSFELETEKAVIELPCPHAGKVTKIHVKKGDRVKVGQTLLTIEAAETTASEVQTPKAKVEAAETPAKPAIAPAAAGVIPAGPATRRMARQLGVDLESVRGSGSHGRITPEDVRAAVTPAATPIAHAPAAPAAVLPPQPLVPPGEPGEDSWGPVCRERISQIRRTIANHMSKSASTIPHVTNFDDADITELEQLRKNVPPGYLGANVRLTLMPFVMKAVANALTHHPLLNANFDEANGQIVYKQYVHLGVAVDTPRGLVVPVLRNVDRMTIPEIARGLLSLSERARQVQFTMEDLRGGTFTLSNLGAVGGTYSTPIINYPEVAILLLGRSRWMPVVRQEKIEKRLMFPLSLSYDHRLVDGAAAARFLNEVIDYLQLPGKLLLGNT